MMGNTGADGQMKPRMFTMAFLAFLAVVSASGAMDPELTRDIGKIEPIRFKSAEALQQFKGDVAALDAKWNGASSLDRAELFRRAADVAGSSYFEGEDRYEQYALEQEYTLKGLQRASIELLPLPTEMRLVFHLRTDLSKAPPMSTEFAQERRLKALLWVHAWQRVELEAAEVFTDADRPFNFVLPPTDKDGTQAPGGLAEDVKDPELRARFENEIRENHAKAQRWNAHSAVMTIKDLFIQQVEHFLEQAYSQGPSNQPELNEILSSVTDQAAKRHILDAITSQRSSNP